LTTLLGWKTDHPSEIFEVDNYVYVSPHDVFKIKYSPDFGTFINGKRCAIHLWNTKKPPPSERLTVGTLSMLKQNYPSVDHLVVLSLLDSRLFWSVDDPRYVSMGQNVVLRIEEAILSVEEELRAPPKDRRTPPTPPHPPA
jgi:hypothetical protein